MTTSPTSTPLDPSAVRAHFPALSPDHAHDTVFLDNAGGSQLPAHAIDAARRYMLESFVQTGADYAKSRAASETVAAAHAFTESLVNAGDTGRVVLGSSTSTLTRMLADCYADARDPDRDPTRNEIVVAMGGHEACVGPWLRLEQAGYVIRRWQIDPDRPGFFADQLEPLLSERTRLVSLPHVSNILGEIVDLAPIVAACKRIGARVCVDGVAYAPHRAPDVRALGVDWYLFSFYKVFGPHTAACFGTHDAWSELEGPNHFFVPRDRIPSKFELGGVNHEACATWLGTARYLAELAADPLPADPIPGAAPPTAHPSTETIRTAFAHIEALEHAPMHRLLTHLADHPRVRLIGSPNADHARVPTISFTHASKPSADIARAANAEHLGIRFGHFYSHRLCADLGLHPDDGVVRVSLVHYNTTNEASRLIAFFDRTL